MLAGVGGSFTIPSFLFSSSPVFLNNETDVLMTQSNRTNEYLVYECRMRFAALPTETAHLRF